MMQEQRERCASDVMQRDIITIAPEMQILDVYRMFVEEEIHGAPVVDESGNVRGVVSTLDLLRVVREELEPGAGATATSYFREELPFSSHMKMPDDLQDRVQQLTAYDAATRELVSVRSTTTVEEVARVMLQQHIHRVLVIDDGELLGVISSFDLLRVVAKLDRPASKPRATGYKR
jgi:CBS domain-containing protein